MTQAADASGSSGLNFVPQSLGEMFMRARRHAPNRLAATDPPDRVKISGGPVRRLTWAEIGAEVDRVSVILLSAGVEARDIVMMPAPSLCETLVCQLAITRIGAVCAPYPAQYRAHEIGALARLIKPHAAIGFSQLSGTDHLQTLLGVLRDSKEDVITLAYGGDLPNGVISLDEGTRTKLSDDQVDRLNRHGTALELGHNEPAFIVFTSGSGAMPKAVLRSHGNLIALRGFVGELGQVGDGVVMLSPRLLSTTGALATGLVPWLHLCGTIILHRPFNLDIFLEQIRTEQPQVASCPPAILHMILQRVEEGATVDLSSLRHISSGSAQLNPSIMEIFAERFGIEVTNAYGSSEGAMLISSSFDVASCEKRARMFPAFGFNGYRSNLEFAKGVETRLVLPQTGEIVTSPGVTAELCFKGPSVFSEYVGDPERTSKAIDADGFYHTGDLFEFVSDGQPFFRFLGRRSNIIVRGGMNISVEEIEGLLADHPAIEEIAIVGRPDPKLGEIVAAVVVPRQGKELSLQDLITYLRHDRQIAIYKLPQHLVVLDELPRLASGKVDLRRLRLIAAEGIGVEEGAGT